MSVSEQDLSKLVSSASLVLVGGILGSVSKLVERIIIAQQLSKSAYGEVSIGLAILGLGGTVALAGFRQGVPRFMSRFEDDADVRGVWVTGLLFTTAASLLVVAFLVVQRDTVTSLLFEADSSGQLLLLFTLVIPFYVWLHVGVGAIRGMENTLYKTYAKDLCYTGVRLVALVGFLALGYGVMAAGYAYLLAAVVGVLVAHLLLGNLMSLSITDGFTVRAREMVAFSGPLLLSSVVGLLLSRTDTLMLGYFRSSAEVGLYSAAYPLAQAMLVILSSFGFMYLPITSRLDSNDKREEVDTVYKLTTKWIYIATFPVFLMLVFFPGDVISLVFGSKYAAAAPALVILAVGFFTNAAGGRNRETLSALGYTEYILGTNVLALALNVALNVLLIPVYGFVGAAVASAASFIAINLVVVTLLELKFDISPFSKWSVRTFLVLPVLLAPPVYVASRVVFLHHYTLPLVAVALAVVSVYTAAVTGCLQPEDTVPLEFIEDRLGVPIPFVDRFVPEGDGVGQSEV